MGWLQDLLKRFNQPNKPAPSEQKANSKSMATLVGRITGGDRSSANFGVWGTDLGIAYFDSADTSRVNLIFGDTFNTAFPGGPDELPGQGGGWRSPVILTSNTPKNSQLVFDYSVGGGSWAKEAFYNAHNTAETWNPLTEFTCIPNDAIFLPETGRKIMSWQSINRWNPSPWRTGYASLSYSDNGQDWFRVPNLGWWNTENNQDPYQMWSMAREGDYVYIISVKAGRQVGPMKLMRVRWDKMFDKNAYELMGNVPGLSTSVAYGEPSLRKVSGVWAMAYVNFSNWTGPRLVTRTAPSITGPWSAEKEQVHIAQEPNLYGGFIDPRSTGGTNGATFYVSRWSKNPGQPTTHYHVSQYVGTL